MSQEEHRDYLLLFIKTCLTLLQPMDCRPDFPGGSVIKNPFANSGNMGLIPRSGRFPGEGNGTPVFLPRKSRGQRSLVGYSPWTEELRVRHD